MSRGLKAAGIVLGMVVVIAIVVAGVWYWFTRQAIPKTDGRIQLSGLQQPVEVLRDSFGVAHIYAHTSEDLFFAQGYSHAQERFWQMEFQRRTAAGRLSEIFGESTLETDRYLRHFDFVHSSEEVYALLDDETRKAIDAYTEGVNAYIADRSPARLGLEFALLGLQGTEWEIEPWTPVDSISWGYMMIFDQGARPSGDIGTANMIGLLGAERYADMFPAYREDRPTIIDSSELDLGSGDSRPLGQLTPETLSYLAALGRTPALNSELPPFLDGLMTPFASGSNSFAVSGELTASGNAVLANDPHMAVRMPALWYEIGMHCIEKGDNCPYEFRGFSLPGVPGILIGHNDRIAWGLTNAYFDAEDVFIERINPEDPNQYEVNGEWVDMEIRREEIVVNGWEKPDVILVRKTRNGVVASDSMVDASRFGAAGDGTEPLALSFAWTGLGPVRTIQSIHMILRSRNWDDFLEAAGYFDAGKQNLIYADVDGNIGYVMPGQVPVRGGGDGSVPVPGWNDDYVWTGYIPFEDLPRVFNPEQGFIVTANNPQVRAEDFPYLLSVAPDRGQRAQRITEMILSDRDKINLEDVQAIQTDNGNLSALEIIPYLRQLTITDPAVAGARDRLVAWGGQMHRDSAEAALFNIFWVRLLANTYNDQLLPEYYPDGKHATADSMYFLLQTPDAGWWNDVRTADDEERRDEILLRSLTEAYAEATATLGEDMTAWKWGDLHTVTFRSDTLGSSGIGFIENIFNRGPFPTSGSESVPQKTCWNVNDGFQVTCIPALRQIVDLGDLNDSLMVHSVGQSGHPMDRHYDDLIEMWGDLQYHPSNWLRESVEGGEHELLVLEPSGN